MAEIKKRLYRLLAEVFSVNEKDITGDVGPGDLPGWDSIGQLRIMLHIEQEFDLQLSVNDILQINNVNDIAVVINKYTQKEEKPYRPRAKKVSRSSVFHPLRIPSTTYWGSGSISVLQSFDFSRIALIVGSSSYARRIIATVRDLIPPNIGFQEFHRSQGEPNESDIVRIAENLQDFSPDLIIAIGGGSTIDTAKLSWLLYEKPNFKLNSIDFSMNDLQLRNKSSFIAIPTTFSGAEVSSAAVFMKANENRKTVFVSHAFIPDNVILDPSLIEGASLSIIYSSAFDALTHAIEGYVSIVNHPLLEPSAIMAVKTIIDGLRKIKTVGVTPNILETLCYAAYYAGLVQNHCSVGLTHSFAHQLGGFGVGHGLANAMFLVPVIECNSSKTNKYTNLISQIGFTSIDDFCNEITTILEAASILPDQRVINKILSHKGLIVEGALNDITYRTNPVSLEQSEVEGVFDNFVERVKT